MQATDNVGIAVYDGEYMLVRKLVSLNGDGSYWLSETKYSRLGRPNRILMDTTRLPFRIKPYGHK